VVKGFLSSISNNKSCGVILGIRFGVDGSSREDMVNINKVGSSINRVDIINSKDMGSNSKSSRIV